MDRCSKSPGVFTRIPAGVLLITAFLFLACTPRAEAREVVYIANVDGVVSALDAATNELITTITLTNPEPDGGPGGQEADVAIAPGGTFAYVLQYARLFVIDTIHNNVTGEIRVNGTRVVFSPDGALAYVAGCNSGGVCVIDTATQAIKAVIPTWPSFASTAAVSPDGHTVYVVDGQHLSLMDTATNRLIAGVSLTGNEQLPVIGSAIAVTPDGKFLYVTRPGSPGGVLVIRVDGLSVAATITVPRDPADIAISPDGRSAYVTNRFGTPFGPDLSAFVSIIDTASNTVTASIPLGVGQVSAFGIALAPDGSRAYVTDIDDTRVFVIDTATHGVSLVVEGLYDGPSYLAVADVPIRQLPRRMHRRGIPPAHGLAPASRTTS